MFSVSGIQGWLRRRSKFFGPQVMGREDLAEVMGRFSSFFLCEKRSHVDEFQVFSLCYMYIYLYIYICVYICMYLYYVFFRFFGFSLHSYFEVQEPI